MLAADDETADALAEFDFVLNDDSGSETDVTVIEVQGDVEMLENVDIAMPEEADYSLTQGMTVKWYKLLKGDKLWYCFNKMVQVNVEHGKHDVLISCKYYFIPLYYSRRDFIIPLKYVTQQQIMCLLNSSPSVELGKGA